MRILITGATGFVGTHLCEYLQKNADTQVYGTSLTDASASVAQIIKCDLLNKEEVASCLAEVKPDFVFHLAAMASVVDAWNDPEKVLVNNVVAQLNILQALIDLNIKPRILVVSTGEVYGAVANEDLPVNESAKLKPDNPYAVSKVTQEFLALQYFESHGIPAIITRSFNHSGPGQKGNFVVPAFAGQIIDIEQGKKEPVMHVGNLEAERDFLDVRDVVRAYWLLIKDGVPGQVYNVCSGKVIKIQKVLDILLSNSSKEIEVRQDSERMRPSGVPKIVGDNTKLRQSTGWQPEIDFEDTLKDALVIARSEAAWQSRKGE